MGQTPCISGFLDMNNKRIDRSIVSMLRSMFDELGLYLWHNFIFPPQGYSRVFKFSKVRYSQEFLLFTIHHYIFLIGRWYNSSKAVDWAIFRKSLPLGAKTALCRLRSAVGRIHWWRVPSDFHKAPWLPVPFPECSRSFLRPAKRHYSFRGRTASYPLRAELPR